MKPGNNKKPKTNKKSDKISFQKFPEFENHFSFEILNLLESRYNEAIKNPLKGKSWEEVKSGLLSK